MRAMRLFAVALLAVSSVACTVANVKPFTGRPDRTTMSDDEKSVWKVSEQQDEAFQNMGADYDDPALQQYIQGIVGKLYPDFGGTIHVHLLKTPVPNAFMMANGSCYVQLGILPLLRNEAQLAMVLGHEGIHFTNRHVFQEHDYAVNSAALGIVVGMVIPILPIAMAYSSMAGYSVQMESQADQLGYRRYVAAGYDPQEAPKPFEALDAYSQALDLSDSYFFADHPKLQTRIKYFAAQAAKSKTGGFDGQAEFVKNTEQAREWVLQELLAREDYKSLVFFLGDKARLADYPVWASYYLGRAYELRANDGDARNAEELYRNVVAADPSYAPAYEALGKALMRHGGHDAEAAQLLRTYLHLQPSAPDRGYIESYIHRLDGVTKTTTGS